MQDLHKVHSYWLKSSKKAKYPSLQKDLDVDILVVGGGITGILTAYELAKENKYSIALVEKNELYHSTTAYTTGKITFQHNAIYQYLLQSKGKEMARLYYEANQKAVEGIRSLVKEHQIDCDFEDTACYLYALKENKNEYLLLQNEREAYDQLGIEYEWLEHQILPLQTEAYLKVNNQAIFNVVKFLDHILTIIPNVEIYEQTKIIKTKKYKDVHIAYTPDGYKIHAKHIVLASHYPFYKRFNFYFTILKPSVSYVCVAEDYKHFSDGAYINILEPILSFRKIPDETPKLLVSGYGHSASKLKDYDEQLKYLTENTEFLFDTNHIKETWYNQDYLTTDQVPMIGRIRNTNFYIATGFNKWGMTTSYISSHLIRDLIMEQKSPYEKLFNPSRSFLTLKTIGYNLKVGYTLIHTKVLSVPKSQAIPPNTGRIIRVGSKKIGVFVTEDKEVIVVKPICPHMGCTLRFNPVTKTYDCPCHGSRFNYDGVCIDGPSPRNLKKYQVKKKEKDL